MGEPYDMKEFPFQGFTILYGTSARDNDRISTELAQNQDFWYHAAGFAGSHVLIRNPDTLADPPKDVETKAAEIAVYHSKARTARGKIEVHACRAGQVRKPPNFPPGKVQISDFRRLKVYPPKSDPTSL